MKLVRVLLCFFIVLILHFAIFAIFAFSCFGMFGRIVFQASAAPGSSRSKVVTGTTTASAAPPGGNLIKLFFPSSLTLNPTR
jgi:hypothetical protein